MKKTILLVFSIFLLAGASALNADNRSAAKADGVSSNAGVPAECEDVMLQAFYWDSYKAKTSTDSKFGRTKWID